MNNQAKTRFVRLASGAIPICRVRRQLHFPFASFNSNRLIPFENISQYLAPAGAFASEDENGLYYTVVWLSCDRL